MGIDPTVSMWLDDGMTTTTATTAHSEFTYGDEGDLICNHRDLSCCDMCANAHDEIVDVFGKHFWIDDADMRAQLMEMA